MKAILSLLLAAMVFFPLNQLAAIEVTQDAASAGFNYYGRWHRGPTAITVNSGSLVEFAYTGNSCALIFDVDGFSLYPGVFAQVDSGPIVRTTLSREVSTVTVMPAFNSLPAGKAPYARVSSRYHFVRFWVASHSLYKTPVKGQQWTTLVGACKFKGVRLNAGEHLLRLPYDSNQIEFLGDSISQGLRLLYTGKEDDIGNQLPYANWPQLVADLLGMKPVVTGFGGHGLTRVSTSGAPPAIEALPYIYAGVKWIPPVEPKVVVIYQTSNDHPTDLVFEDLYHAFLVKIRKTYPTALIFAICPHTYNTYAATIRRAVTQTHDQRIVFLDYSSGVTTKGETCDGAHLNPGGAVAVATRMASDISARLNPGP